MRARRLIALLVTGALMSQAAAAVLTKENAMALVELQASGTKAVSVAVVTAPGQSAAVAAMAVRAGGRVRYRFAPADFASLVLPADSVRKFLEEPRIEAAGIDLPDAEYRYRGLTPESPGSDATLAAQWPVKPSAYPLEHPYDVLRALDADGFRKRNPSFDGRGVVIAQVEAMSDLLTPELRTALDIEGREVPKFLDVLNHPDVKPTLDEQAPRSDWQWVVLSATLPVQQGQVTHAGARYRVPVSSSAYRIGTLEMPTHILVPINLVGAGKTEGAQTDYNSLTRQMLLNKTTTFTVLWSESAHIAWLDTNRNGDFTDEQGVREYRVSHDIGVLGRDDPATARRESRPYVIQKDGDSLSVNIDCNLHATMVAGVATASRGPNGRIDGVAPGAQVLAINHGKTFSSFGWALIAAFADERTDVVLVEASFPPAGAYALKDGRSLLGTLTSRLSRRYRKPSFWTAGNEPFMSAIVDASVAPETISIGAYDSQDSFQLHYGVRLPWKDTVHAVGSEGPAGNGDLKPDLLAPSMMAAPRDGYLANDGISSLPGLYQLPEGYFVSGGTSAATPIASGAAALLVSAAKQGRVPHDAARIKRALTESARYLSGAGSYQQGAGVIQVGGAWAALLRQVHAQEPLSIDVAAPVNTVNSRFLSTPDRGIGVFEREGWHVGERAIRHVTLTRRNGPAGSMRFSTRWQGNQDGAFSAAREVSLPLARPVTLDIEIAPKTEGVYSATLQLFAESQSTLAGRIPVTIVVPYELSAATGFSQELQIEVPILGRKPVFVRVPAGTDALSVAASHTSRYTYFVIQDPAGDRRGFYVQPNSITGTSLETIPTPEAGVWGIFTYDSSGRAAYFGTQPEFAAYQSAGAPPPVKMTLHISAAAASIAMSTGAAPLVYDKVQALSITNTLAPLERARVTGRLGVVRSSRGRIERGERQTFDINVRSGAELLVAEVKPTSADADALDADLYLFNCTGAKCFLMRTSRGHGSRERVFIQDPQPGTWRVVLDAGAATGRSMSYEYTDFFTAPDAGVLSVIDPAVDRMSGAQWQVLIKPWTIDTPTPGRRLGAVLFVQDALRTARLDGETSAEVYGCKTSPYCGTASREVVPMGLIGLELATAAR